VSLLWGIQDFGTVVPHDGTTYVFSPLDEAEYKRDYRMAYYVRVRLYFCLYSVLVSRLECRLSSLADRRAQGHSPALTPTPFIVVRPY
jgi:hypothetical protein